MKAKHLTIILAAVMLFSVLLVSGCVDNAQNTTDTTKVVVEAGDTVAVDYTGRYENGTVFDTSIGREPLEFKAGAGQMIRGFDAAVIGMAEGEEKTITLPPEDAYGIHDPDLVRDFPITSVPNDTKVGDKLFAETQPVVVVGINETTVTIDLNHPMVGKTLIFDIKILSITKG